MKKIILYGLLFMPLISQAVTNDCQYLVNKINGDPVISSNKPTITFDKQENRVYGNASCNRYFGSYTEINDSITIDKLGSTLMACYPNEVNIQERNFLSVLSSVKSVSINKNDYIFLDDKFNKVIEAKKCAK